MTLDDSAAPLPVGRDLALCHDHIELTVRLRRRLRLDQFLKRELGWSSRTKIQQLIALDRVRVNGEAPKPATRVTAGDRITVELTPGGAALLEDSEPISEIIAEDAYLVAVQKPPGRLVHPVGRNVSGTIINELHHRYQSLRYRGQRPIVAKLCHRLDRDTSGLLIVAKCDTARRRLQLAFERERVRKVYWAIVEGELEPRDVLVDVPVAVTLDRARQSGNRLAQSSADGKASRTWIRPLTTSHGYSWVECRPETGRQNQIRVHLAEIGHPILGDHGYGSDAERWRRSPLGRALPYPGRALLHSHSLRFPHPIFGVEQCWRAAPYADFERYRLCVSNAGAEATTAPLRSELGTSPDDTA